MLEYVNANILKGFKMKYWLMKTEPESFSWTDLKNAKNHTTHWEGVRNYQARNYMKEMKKGDHAFFYHSSVKPTAIMGIAKIAREAYPDFSQFDPASKYYDPKSTQENPRWFMVDIKVEKEFPLPITLEELKEVPGLEKMVLLQKGSRLSVQPVTLHEWEIIAGLGKFKIK
jgi:predicted RNA-binding protein with PUA-like domain